MDQWDLSFYIFLFFVAIIIVRMYYRSEHKNLKCLSSSIDGKTYCVRERQNQVQAADLLAMVSQKCQSMVDYMISKYPHKLNFIKTFFLKW